MASPSTPNTYELPQPLIKTVSFLPSLESYAFGPWDFCSEPPRFKRNTRPPTLKHVTLYIRSQAYLLGTSTSSSTCLVCSSSPSSVRSGAPVSSWRASWQGPLSPFASSHLAGLTTLFCSSTFTQLLRHTFVRREDRGIVFTASRRPSRWSTSESTTRSTSGLLVPRRPSSSAGCIPSS